MQPGECYSLHFDEGPFGSGRRVLLVVAIGPKWITAINPATLAIGQIAGADWRRHRPQAVPVRPGRLVNRIERRARQYRRLGVPFAHKTVRQAIKRLRAA